MAYSEPARLPHLYATTADSITPLLVETKRGVEKKGMVESDLLCGYLISASTRTAFDFVGLAMSLN
jgi:hypothetical protein